MIEIIAITVEDAQKIELADADRIELISSLAEGGLTPSYALIKSVVNKVNIPVNVMIRPHSKGFVYTDEEIDIMKEDIKQVKDLGANGVVFGVLNSRNEIDINKLESLLDVCNGLDVTFHKAIDETEVIKSTEILSKYDGITTILTSGGNTPILQNIEVIKHTIEKSRHMDILLGGGLNMDNVKEIRNKTSCLNFHFGSAVRTNNEIDIDKIKKIKKLSE